ncbi:hypothetical protein C8A00DRAFT_30547 [Chaetomidium leptoderma]|uniref:C2H2-type domain-containing protein n=1 Tax=Chaetomidium leptoderma TaxID=669021 RepID=A0AAN6VTH1_9PEZI|nr:hypothetical protein C8A00DRAFT_30547 [Chaetomidium leptoderma]
MGLTTILRGFKVPVAVLDRFFEANGLIPTYGYPPTYDPVFLPGDDKAFATQDPHSAFLRTKLADNTHNQNTLFFIPNREGTAMSTHAYVSYAYVMVFCQRQIDVAGELPDKPPPGFAELRSEILGFATEGEEGLLQVAGMQPAGGGQDPASMLFIVVTDERGYPWKGPFLRKSDRCCDQCPEEFDSWISLREHRKEVHGVIGKETARPDDL